jgi:hypothetical protein
VAHRAIGALVDDAYDGYSVSRYQIDGAVRSIVDWIGRGDGGTELRRRLAEFVAAQKDLAVAEKSDGISTGMFYVLDELEIMIERAEAERRCSYELGKPEVSR